MTRMLLSASALALALSGPAFAQQATPATAPAAAPAPAVEVAPLNNSVLVLDGARLIRDSAAGKDMTAKLTAIGTTIQNESRAGAQPLETEAQALQKATAGLSPAQIRANADLRTRVEAFERRLQTQEAADQRRGQELQLTELRAREEFNRVVGPVVQETVAARGGLILLDRGDVSYAVPGVDITADVIERLDQRVRTVNVTRQTPPAQPAAAPAAGATAPAPGATAPRPATPPAAAPTTPPRRP